VRVIDVRNVHQALYQGLAYIAVNGVRRDSRNGTVIVAPGPVVTIYRKPLERVVFWPERDANPFFHLYESLWMLAGRNDLKGLTRYVKDFDKFSDDGRTLDGAYGYRWREFFNIDQLKIIAGRLRDNPNDRRSVLQMWSPKHDLNLDPLSTDADHLDVPCNLTATFQINTNGELDMAVFCRSNDMLLGAYGANAVHFGFLQEYMATWIGVPVGTYIQFSANMHVYADKEGLGKTLVSCLPMLSAREERCFVYADETTPGDKPLLMYPAEFTNNLSPQEYMEDLDDQIGYVLRSADLGFPEGQQTLGLTPGLKTIYNILRAHHIYKTTDGMGRFHQSIELLRTMDQNYDWTAVALDWLTRRFMKRTGQTHG